MSTDVQPPIGRLSAFGQPAPQMGAGYWQVLSRIANHSGEALTQTSIRLVIDGATAVTGFFDARAETVKSFYVTRIRTQRAKPLSCSMRMHSSPMTVSTSGSSPRPR